MLLKLVSSHATRVCRASPVACTPLRIAWLVCTRLHVLIVAQPILQLVVSVHQQPLARGHCARESAALMHTCMQPHAHHACTHTMHERTPRTHAHDARTHTSHARTYTRTHAHDARACTLTRGCMDVWESERERERRVRSGHHLRQRHPHATSALNGWMKSACHAAATPGHGMCARVHLGNGTSGGPTAVGIKPPARAHAHGGGAGRPGRAGRGAAMREGRTRACACGDDGKLLVAVMREPL